MRKVAIIALASLAMAASPALAQGRGGGHGGGGGAGDNAGGGMGMGGGMGAGGGMGMGMGNGAGPPMTVPGQTDDPRSAASDIASQRGQFGRDFAQQQKMNQADQARMIRDRVRDYTTSTDRDRTEALKMRDEARTGKPVRQSSQEIRAQLKQDMENWRDTFKVGRKDWQQVRDQILVDAGTLTPAQWAERRAQWFDARDQWIAKQVEWAQTHGGTGSDTGTVSETGDTSGD
jgi:hypothetical protein